MKNPVGLLDYVKWIFGVGTWYYFFTVFTCYLLIFKLLAKKDCYLYLCLLIQIVINFLPSLGITFSTNQFATFCMLIPSYIGYFALGIFIRRYRIDRSILTKTGSLYAVIVVAGSSFVVNRHGWITIIPWWTLSMATLFFYLSTQMAKSRWAERLTTIGTYSYCIFLLHMQIVQPICRQFPQMIVFDIIKPFISLVIMVGMIEIGKAVCKCIPHGDILRRLVGLR